MNPREPEQPFEAPWHAELFAATHALAQAGAQGLVGEAVDLAQQRAVGPAGEAAVLLVDEAQGEQLGGLELGREVALLPRGKRRPPDSRT